MHRMIPWLYAVAYSQAQLYLAGLYPAPGLVGPDVSGHCYIRTTYIRRRLYSAAYYPAGYNTPVISGPDKAHIFWGPDDYPAPPDKTRPQKYRRGADAC